MTHRYLAFDFGAESGRLIVGTLADGKLELDVLHRFPTEGITMLDAIECWIYQHGLRHMGEIELARGLVGLGGMTS